MFIYAVLQTFTVIAYLIALLIQKGIKKRSAKNITFGFGTAFLFWGLGTPRSAIYFIGLLIWIGAWAYARRRKQDYGKQKEFEVEALRLHNAFAREWYRGLYIRDGKVEEWLDSLTTPVVGGREINRTKFIEWLRARPEVNLIRQAAQDKEVLNAFVRNKAFHYPINVSWEQASPSLAWHRIPNEDWANLSLAVFKRPIDPTLQEVLSIAITHEAFVEDIKRMTRTLEKKTNASSKPEDWVKAYIAEYPQSDPGKAILAIVLMDYFPADPSIHQKGYVDRAYAHLAGEAYKAHLLSQAESPAPFSIWSPNTTAIEFERWVGTLLGLHGYAVKSTKTTGDQGADLVIEGKGIRGVVQVKLYASPVGNDAVQEAVAAKGYYQADEAWVATNSNFTKSAKELALANGVRLFNGDKLKEMAQQIPQVTVG